MAVETYNVRDSMLWWQSRLARLCVERSYSRSSKFGSKGPEWTETGWWRTQSVTNPSRS